MPKFSLLINIFLIYLWSIFEVWNLLEGRYFQCFLWNSTLHKKRKVPIDDFFSKCDQIRSFLRIWSHLLKSSLTGNFIFCAVLVTVNCYPKQYYGVSFIDHGRVDFQGYFALLSLLLRFHFEVFSVCLQGIKFKPF